MYVQFLVSWSAEQPDQYFSTHIFVFNLNKVTFSPNSWLRLTGHGLNRTGFRLAGLMDGVWVSETPLLQNVIGHLASKTICLHFILHIFFTNSHLGHIFMYFVFPSFLGHQGSLLPSGFSLHTHFIKAPAALLKTCTIPLNLWL